MPRVTRRLFLARHGEPLHRDVFYGHHDMPLSPRGHEQAKAQARWFANVALDEIWTSDLTRARVGAQAVLATSPATLRVTAALREMHLGVVEGVPHREAAVRWPALANLAYDDMLDQRFEGGGQSVRELDAQVQQFVVPALRACERPEGFSLLIYAHNTVVRLLLAHAAQIAPAGYVKFVPDVGSISCITWDAPLANALWTRARIAWSNRVPS